MIGERGSEENHSILYQRSFSVLCLVERYELVVISMMEYKWK